MTRVDINPNAFSTQEAAEDGDVWTVAELHPAVSRALIDSELRSLTVRGTVTSTKHHKSGTSFQLVTYDQSFNPVAVLAVFMASSARTSSERSRVGPISDGVEISLGGKLEVRPDWGQLRFNATTIIGPPVTARSTLHRDALLARFTNSGQLLNQQRLHTPVLPRRVGAIYGANSAAQADIRRILTSRQTPVELIEAPIFTTGVDAPARIAAAIHQFTRDRKGIDLLIVARGGGGRAELDVFDAEAVVTAITASPIPVWTAIGHAQDLTLADRCAQQHFATPTGVAEELARLHTLADTVSREQHQTHVATRRIIDAQQETTRAYQRNRRLILAVVALIIAVVFLASKVL
jgi:exodeoxyribonuclease VII large subunit